MSNEATTKYYKVVKRNENGELISPFTPDKYAVLYTPDKATYPIIGKLFVIKDMEIALGLINTFPTYELWKCEVGNPTRWHSSAFDDIDMVSAIELYWDGVDINTSLFLEGSNFTFTKYRTVAITPFSTHACDWVMLTKQL